MILSQNVGGIFKKHDLCGKSVVLLHFVNETSKLLVDL